MRSDALLLFVARGFGTGLVPRAPGTAGSLLGIPLYWGLLQSGWPPLAQALALVVFVAVSCVIAGRAEELIGKHDSGEIVIDEIAGMAVALFAHEPTLLNIAVIFALFRFFDIVKIWPANLIDRRMPGGRGVVLDDVVSGLYASLLAWGIGF
ncbi:MAG: phosphatidylglycerophosphatase A [Deltaproteobacteria bacterium]